MSVQKIIINYPAGQTKYKEADDWTGNAATVMQ
jgi:hypothetical protein